MKLIKKLITSVLNAVLGGIEYKAYYEARDLLGHRIARKTRACIIHDRLNEWLTN